MRKGKITIENISGGWSNDFAKDSSISSYQTTNNTYYSGLLNINAVNPFLTSFPLVARNRLAASDIRRKTA